MDERSRSQISVLLWADLYITAQKFIVCMCVPEKTRPPALDLRLGLADLWNKDRNILCANESAWAECYLLDPVYCYAWRNYVITDVVYTWRANVVGVVVVVTLVAYILPRQLLLPVAVNTVNKLDIVKELDIMNQLYMMHQTTHAVHAAEGVRCDRVCGQKVLPRSKGWNPDWVWDDPSEFILIFSNFVLTKYGSLHNLFISNLYVGQVHEGFNTWEWNCVELRRADAIMIITIDLGGVGKRLQRKCSLKTHVWNLGYPSPYKSGAQNHLFWRLRNLTANLTAYIFGTNQYQYQQLY